MLVLDIGNTHVTAGFYRSGRLAASWRMATEANRTADEYGLQCLQLLHYHGFVAEDVQRLLAVSVVPAVSETTRLMGRKYFGREAEFVEAAGQRFMKVDYDPPGDLGNDRIVNAIAAAQKYGLPVLVADLGTAVTLDLVDAAGVFRGGAILPGVNAMGESLYLKTARLPRVPFARPARPAGRSTRECVQAGLYYGLIFGLEGLVKLYRGELGPETKVVATGGQAETLLADRPWIDAIDPELTLEGLYRISQMTGHD